MNTSEENLVLIKVNLTETAFRAFSDFNELYRTHKLLKMIIFSILLILFALCHLYTHMPYLCIMYLIIGIILPLVYLTRYRKSVKTQIDKLKLKDHPMHAYDVGITERGIWIQRDKEHAAFSWDQLVSAYRAREATYIYYMENRALILPDASIIEGDQTLLSSLLAEHLKDKYTDKHIKGEKA